MMAENEKPRHSVSNYVYKKFKTIDEKISGFSNYSRPGPNTESDQHNLQLEDADNVGQPKCQCTGDQRSPRQRGAGPHLESKMISKLAMHRHLNSLPETQRTEAVHLVSNKYGNFAQEKNLNIPHRKISIEKITNYPSSTLYTHSSLVALAPRNDHQSLATAAFFSTTRLLARVAYIAK